MVPQSPGGYLFHATPTKIVFVEALEVPDLVQERVADLLGQLDTRLHRACEVLAVEDDRRGFVAGRWGAANRASVEAEDRRWERRLDGFDVVRIGKVGNLDLDLVDMRAPLG